MKLVECDVRVINELKAYRRSINLELLEEFLASDKAVMRVEEFTHKTAKGCATALNTSIKIYKLHGVKAGVRGDRVYLYRTDK
jgi:hypothetical protein